MAVSGDMAMNNSRVQNHVSGRITRQSSLPDLPYKAHDLAPANPVGSGAFDAAGSKRTQKHPATFQCTLCPKRFRRAYNLRSHLRTHTGERPFVCSICGKGFALQHHRKRHESLHSGEKKFVCGGTPPAEIWGCGRRFARLDIFARHLRSKAGQAWCLSLLKDEGDSSHQDGWPPALLSKYPELSNLDWDKIDLSGQAYEEVDSGTEGAIGINPAFAERFNEDGHYDTESVHLQQQ